MMNSLRELGAVIACVWMLFLCRTCSGKFVVEKNNLRVTSPEAIRGVHECAIGNFGVPQYGGTLIGTVVYPKANQNACNRFDVSFKSNPGGMPIFLLADRGDCYFTLKAWNAQNAGAGAILVTDNRIEPLITMDAPEEQDKRDDYVQNISIPSALISKTLGDDIKKALISGRQMVNINLDWRESLPHPDDRVEYEFWTNSNDECGPKCDAQINFVKSFKGAAQILEKKGYAQFIPRYITWYCPEAFIMSQQCQSQCINNGRYCAPDPEGDFSRGYSGRDVVLQNLRQACLFKVANESYGKPWIWWDYVTDFSIRCPMKERRYNAPCANQVLESLGVDVKKIDKCMGNPDADVENQVLKAEQENQVGRGTRGDVTILPTLVINNRQYRGKLDKSAVLKAICSAFKETTEPAICLAEGIETNQCMDNNGGCWHHKAANITACRDTFRGRVCECPVVQGVRFVGDGYTRCEASGALRCGINNGGCWEKTQKGTTYSACIDDHSKGCKCPSGFRGDGVKSCKDIDECKERLACQCPECKCKNTWGSYDCDCRGSKLYIREHDTCISKDSNTEVGWGFIWVIILGLATAGLGGYIIYKYRFQRYMDSEIRAIMAQYMPLDSDQAPQDSHHVQLGGV